MIVEEKQKAEAARIEGQDGTAPAEAPRRRRPREATAS